MRPYLKPSTWQLSYATVDKNAMQVENNIRSNGQRILSAELRRRANSCTGEYSESGLS